MRPLVKEMIALGAMAHDPLRLFVGGQRGKVLAAARDTGLVPGDLAGAPFAMQPPHPVRLRAARREVLHQLGATELARRPVEALAAVAFDLTHDAHHEVVPGHCEATRILTRVLATTIQRLTPPAATRLTVRTPRRTTSSGASGAIEAAPL